MTRLIKSEPLPSLYNNHYDKSGKLSQGCQHVADHLKNRSTIESFVELFCPCRHLEYNLLNLFFYSMFQTLINNTNFTSRTHITSNFNFWRCLSMDIFFQSREVVVIWQSQKIVEMNAKGCSCFFSLVDNRNHVIVGFERMSKLKRKLIQRTTLRRKSTGITSKRALDCP